MVLSMVPRKGLEPLSLAAPDLKSGASTNSATRARAVSFYHAHGFETIRFFIYVPANRNPRLR